MSRRRHFKRTKKENNEYYQREILLNRKIRQFKNDYYNQSNPPVPHEYWHMDELRREIKYLFYARNIRYGQNHLIANMLISANSPYSSQYM